jgi:hypothetical protein
MLFDEHNHPVSSKTVSREQRARCVWRRCYKLISLIHTNRSGDFFLYGAVNALYDAMLALVSRKLSKSDFAEILRKLGT